MNKKKKIDRPPVESGEPRGMLTSRVDKQILKKARAACFRKYKVGLSSKVEDFLINEFPEILKGHK